MTGDDFWSRRKAAVREENATVERAKEDAAAEEQQQQLAEKSDEEILAELDLPDPEQLQKGDDFSAFLKKSVPQHLQRKALRRLWLTDPTLANLDNLIDYGEDFTDAALVVENLQTTYQVGKGMLKHILATEEQKKADEEETEDSADDDDILISAAENDPAPEPEALAANADLSLIEDTEDLPETENHEYTGMSVEQPTRRRMRFRFGDEDPDASV